MASNWSTHLVLGFVFLDLVKCLLCFQFIKVACVICEAIIDQLDQKLTPKRKADSPSGDDEEKKWRGYDLSSIPCCSIFFHWGIKEVKGILACHVGAGLELK